MSNILVIGNFGYESNQLDGQTVKTRNIFELLRRNGLDVVYCDTQWLRKSMMRFFVLASKVIGSKNIIIIPASNMLKYIFPFVFFISKVFSKNLVCVPVGGWLCWYLKDKRVLKYMLSNIKAVLPQTMDDVLGLQKSYDMNNVYYFPNFRISDFIPNIERKKRKMKLLFFARINKMKGLDIVFDIADKIVKDSLDQEFIIDFYGQVNEVDSTYFFDGINKYDFVSYKGFIEPEKIYATLSEYDLLLFPTRYINDEGFPGTILDGYMSGIPVIASNWCHSKEFVKEGYCGYICDIDNPCEFYEKIMYLYENMDVLLEMKNNAYEESKNYSSEKAYKLLISHLNLS